MRVHAPRFGPGRRAGAACGGWAEWDLGGTWGGTTFSSSWPSTQPRTHATQKRPAAAAQVQAARATRARSGLGPRQAAQMNVSAGAAGADTAARRGRPRSRRSPACMGPTWSGRAGGKARGRERARRGERAGAAEAVSSSESEGVESPAESRRAAACRVGNDLDGRWSLAGMRLLRSGRRPRRGLCSAAGEQYGSDESGVEAPGLDEMRGRNMRAAASPWSVSVSVVLRLVPAGGHDSLAPVVNG